MRLYGRPGDDLTKRFPLIVDALARLRASGSGAALERMDRRRRERRRHPFFHACQLGLEGIVSKRKDSPYRSARSANWLKMKSPALRSGEAGRGGLER